MTQHRPLILVTNDDGMFAPGIKRLVEITSQMGKSLLLHLIRHNQLKVMQ
jgi:hypothetical protein